MTRRLIVAAVAIAALWFSRANSADGPYVANVREDGSPLIVANVEAKPILTYYVADGSWCPQCNVAKRELKAEKNLPFEVEYQTKHPKWVTTLPTAHWQTDHDGARQYVGWPGVKPLVEMFERSRTKAAAGATHDARLPAVASVRLPAGYHTHTCRFDGTRWGHVEGSRGASHNCPKCGRAEYRKD